MELTYKLLGEALRAGKKIVLVSLVSSAGSAPRHGGSKMAVLEKDVSIGTVGGGALEGRAIEIAAGCLSKGVSLREEFVLTAESSSRLGMTCGGDVQVLFEYIDGADADALGFFSILEDFVEQRQSGRYVTFFRDGRVAHQLFNREGSLVAECGGQGISESIDFLQKALLGEMSDGSSGDSLSVEIIAPEPQCLVFGCGHVGVEIACIAQRCGFRIGAIDDRPEFADSARFPSRVNVLCAPFADAWRELTVDENTFLVIVTRGHQHDEMVLRQALRTPAKYIGMIGSRTKVQGIMNRLRESCFSERDLARVYAPIGLRIAAETPAEIAVSVVAEMIQVLRNHGK